MNDRPTPATTIEFAYTDEMMDAARRAMGMPDGLTWADGKRYTVLTAEQRGDVLVLTVRAVSEAVTGGHE